MRARVLRALFLLFVGAMLAVYAATVANSSAPNDLHDSFQVVGEQWC
jgi:hypothetical protein